MKNGRSVHEINDQLHSSIPFGHANPYLHPTHSVCLAHARKTQWATAQKPSSKVWLELRFSLGVGLNLLKKTYA